MLISPFKTTREVPASLIDVKKPSTKIDGASSMYPRSKRKGGSMRRLSHLILLVSGVVYASSPDGPCFVRTCSHARASERQTPLVKAMQRVLPSVVSIRGEKTISASTPQAAGTDDLRRVRGMGSGVILDPRGYILTNEHVVDGVSDIRVTTATEKRYVATLIARDSTVGLAIIKIDPTENLAVIPIGISSDLMPAETVLAIGNSFGYENTITKGIISALHRKVQISDAQFYDDLIQMDASINPGNSGGPLLNADGEMIGLNTAVRAGAQGIGFAIPVDTVTAVAARLLAASPEIRAGHGIEIDDGARSAAGRPVASIKKIDSDSPAAAADLKPGDVITMIGDMPVQRPLDFQRGLLGRKPGEVVAIRVHRANSDLTKKLTLAEKLAPAELPNATTVERPVNQLSWDVFGLQFEPIRPEQFQEMHNTKYRGGLKIVDVREGSPAKEQSIRPNDVLVGLHIWETLSRENVDYILKRPNLKTFNPIKFYILRGTETLYGYMTIPPSALPSE